MAGGLSAGRRRRRRDREQRIVEPGLKARDTSLIESGCDHEQAVAGHDGAAVGGRRDRHDRRRRVSNHVDDDLRLSLKADVVAGDRADDQGHTDVGGRGTHRR